MLFLRAAGCTSWYDGCNTCAVNNEGGRQVLGGCTMMYCATPGDAYCLEFGGRPGAATVGAMGGQADGDGYGDGGGFNCCGGGGACGYEHCPALGEGQDGCVQPWAMPNGMDFDTDCALSGAVAVGSSGACAAALAATGTQNVIGSYVPQCDEAGNYEPVQCHGSTGYCWCSDTQGNEIENTRSRGPVDIDTCSAATHTTATLSTAALECDVTRISAACAHVDATNSKYCNSPCHELAAQLVSVCKTSVVASDLQQMISTCGGH